MDKPEIVVDIPPDSWSGANIPPNLSAQLLSLENNPPRDLSALIGNNLGDFEDLAQFDRLLAQLGYTPREEVGILVGIARSGKLENVRLAAVRTLMARRTELMRKSGASVQMRRIQGPDGSTSMELMAKGMMYVSGKKVPGHTQQNDRGSTPESDPPGIAPGGDSTTDQSAHIGTLPGPGSGGGCGGRGLGGDIESGGGGTTEVLSRQPRRTTALPGLAVGYGLRTTAYKKDSGRGGRGTAGICEKSVVRGVGVEGFVGEVPGMFPPCDEMEGEGGNGEAMDEIERRSVPEKLGSDPVGADGRQHQECAVGGACGSGAHDSVGGDRIPGISQDGVPAEGMSAVRIKKTTVKRGRWG